MNKKNEYIKNTIILFIGKFSSQLVSFILLPLYTYKLLTDNYGYVDLIQTYISIIAPVLLLQLDSAVFRFLVDCREKEKEKEKIITTSFVFVISILVISTAIMLIIRKVINIKYYLLIILNTIAMIINMYFLSIARGNGDNKAYSISSIISAFSNLIMNFILILIFNFDAKCILIASIVSNILGSVYLFKKEKVFKYLKIKENNTKCLKELLIYSVPMIPNVLSWWIVNVSDRTIIVYFISAAANGVYAISCKFSNVLNSIFSIFNLSWQETISLHIKDDDASNFISSMMSKIFCLFIMASCCIIGLMPLVFNIVIGENYNEAYNYIPILLIGNIFSVLVGLLGGVYVANKMTKKVASTTIISAIINIVINICFIKKIGLYAACISTVIAYFVMMIYRYFDVQKYIKVKLYWKMIVKYVIILIICVTLYYMRIKILSLIITLISILLYLKDNKTFLLETIKKIKK